MKHLTLNIKCIKLIHLDKEYNVRIMNLQERMVVTTISNYRSLVDNSNLLTEQINLYKYERLLLFSC